MNLIRKRKLTHQQSRRIAEQNQRRRQAPSDDHLAPLEGLIVAHYGRQLEVQALIAPQFIDPEQPITIHQGDVWRCHARTNLPMLVTGDQVQWQADPNTGLGVITALHDRTSVLLRPDRYHNVKAVASNVTRIFIVFAPLPTPSPLLIDRYLVACETAEIEPVLVLNKSDLLTPDDPLNQLVNEYRQLGYCVLVVNRKGDLGELRQAIAQQRVVFVGQSGVGKSSLINELLPAADQKINIISENSQLGQHTTTTTRLLPLCPTNPDAGALIDSPGIREFGVWNLKPDDIRNGFVDLRPWYGQCRFRNCSHRHERDCALQDAAARGDILVRRLESYHRLLDESNST